MGKNLTFIYCYILPNEKKEFVFPTRVMISCSKYNLQRDMLIYSFVCFLIYSVSAKKCWTYLNWALTLNGVFKIVLVLHSINRTMVLPNKAQLTNKCSCQTRYSYGKKHLRVTVTTKLN